MPQPPDSRRGPAVTPGPQPTTADHGTWIVPAHDDRQRARRRLAAQRRARDVAAMAEGLASLVEWYSGRWSRLPAGDLVESPFWPGLVEPEPGAR